MRLELANPVRSVRSDPHMELLLDQVGDPDRNEWVFDCLSVAQSDTPSVWDEKIINMKELKRLYSKL